jgi:sporulation-control protein
MENDFISTILGGLCMLLKKMLAKLGKGAATIQIALDQNQCRIGETVTGELLVTGGVITQSIRKIDVVLKLDMVVKDHPYTQSVHQIIFDEPFQLEPEEEKNFPFSFEVPKHVLLSSSHIGYQLIAELDIESGIDSVDRQPIEILPSVPLQNLFAALEKLGFKETHGSRSYDGYLQEFEWAPTDLFYGQIEEIEFNVTLEEEGMHLLLEVDVYQFLGEKEVKRELFLDHSMLEDVDGLANYLQQVIEEVIQQPAMYHADKQAFRAKYLASSGALGAVAVGLVAKEILDEIEDEVEDLVEDLTEQDDDDSDDDQDEGFFFEDEDDED